MAWMMTVQSGRTGAEEQKKELSCLPEGHQRQDMLGTTAGRAFFERVNSRKLRNIQGRLT
jgi:hypothetical protein